MDGRTRVRLVACVPLCLLALALALVAFNAQGDESTVLAAKLAKTAAKPAAKVKQTIGLQQLELIHVKKCAKEITGSDKPRKLPPAQAKAVNECAKKFMPPTHTKLLLQAAAKKILEANHQKADSAAVKKLMSGVGEQATSKHATKLKESAKARIQSKAVAAAKH